MAAVRLAKWIGVFLALCALSSAVKAQTNQVSAVRQFVQRFYDWYVPLNQKQLQVAPSALALKVKTTMFAPQLLRALREDAAAQAKVKDEVVGLDFDPFLNSQDPATRYVVGKVSRKGSLWYADVHSVTSGKRSPRQDVVAQMEKAGTRWRFVNFLYSEDGDLLRILRRLKHDRKGIP